MDDELRKYLQERVPDEDFDEIEDMITHNEKTVIEVDIRSLTVGMCDMQRFVDFCDKISDDEMVAHSLTLVKKARESAVALLDAIMVDEDD